MAALNLDGMKARWERLSERERWTVMAGSAAAVLVVLAFAAWMVGGRIDDLSDDNTQIRQALKDLEQYRGSYQKAKDKSGQFESRIGQGSVQLEGLLETAATQSDVTISETTERPKQAVKNTKYVERSVDLRIVKCTLEELTKFLRHIETGPTLVVVTGLLARVRDDKHEDLTVEMTVSTWERAPDAKAGKKPAAGGEGQGGGEAGDGTKEGKS